MSARGIDVSKWQGKIDWTRVAADGISFAFIRASHGDTEDPRFVENWRGAVDAGIIPSAYHYYEHPGADAHLQAHTFLAQLATVWRSAGPMRAPMLPPVLDAEEGKPGAEALLEWLEAIEGVTGLCPWIYTSTGWWTPAIGDDERFARHPLWVAHWGVQKPVIPRPWTDWIVWQASNQGLVTGITTDVDTNVYNGSIDDLRWMARCDLASRDLDAP